MQYVVICLSVCVGLLAIAMPISIRRTREIKMPCSFPCRLTVSNCNFTKLSRYRDLSMPFSKLVADCWRTDRSWSLKNGIGQSVHWWMKFVAKYIEVTGSVEWHQSHVLFGMAPVHAIAATFLGWNKHILKGQINLVAHMSYLEWPQYRQA